MNGAPSFLPGGNPTLECQTYWLDIRRALLRFPVDRIGFGGYLSLVQNHPKFIKYVTALGEEFRHLKSLHVKDRPYTAPVKVAILSAWGNRRAWACCGHYNHGNQYNEVMETLSGLAVETVFIGFEDLLSGGVPAGVQVIVNAGSRDDAWSGGRYWSDPRVIEILSGWVAKGGGLIGVGEPSAREHGGRYFQLSHLLGVERELGLTSNRTKYAFEKPAAHFITADAPTALALGKEAAGVYVLDGDTTVLLDDGKAGVRAATRATGKGRAVYLAGHVYDADNARLLARAVFWAARREKDFAKWTSMKTWSPQTSSSSWARV